MEPVNEISRASLLLQLAHRSDGISGKQCGVLPGRVGHRRGDDVLLERVQLIGDAGGVVLLDRPEAAEVFEGLPPQQDRIAGGAVALQELLLVGWGVGGVEPVVQHLDRAVDGHVLCDHQFSHRCLLGGRGALRRARQATSTSITAVGSECRPRRGWARWGRARPDRRPAQPSRRASTPGTRQRPRLTCMGSSPRAVLPRQFAPSRCGQISPRFQVVGAGLSEGERHRHEAHAGRSCRIDGGGRRSGGGDPSLPAS